MDDSKDTVLIKGLSGDYNGMEFINKFQQFGEIKTDSETARRLAEMKSVEDGSEKQGIVTYVNQHSAINAIKGLNETELEGKKIVVSTPDKHFFGKLPSDQKVPREFPNMAWLLWNKYGLRKDGGGQGGEGGTTSSSGFFSWFGSYKRKDGHDGEAGEPGGKGGKGGKSGASAH